MYLKLWCPYKLDNSLLAVSKLIEHADCVLPIDNQSLIEISDKIQGTPRYQKDQKEEVVSFVKTKKGKPFDTMNNIAAHMLLNLTRYLHSLVYC